MVHAALAAPLTGLVPCGPSARGVKPRMLDEDRLIARAAGGETSAFRELYEHHRADVARLVYRMLGPRSDNNKSGRGVVSLPDEESRSMEAFSQLTAHPGARAGVESR